MSRLRNRTNKANYRIFRRRVGKYLLIRNGMQIPPALVVRDGPAGLLTMRSDLSRSVGNSLRLTLRCLGVEA